MGDGHIGGVPIEGGEGGGVKPSTHYECKQMDNRKDIEK